MSKWSCLSPYLEHEEMHLLNNNESKWTYYQKANNQSEVKK